jgi:hypothetical protein
MQPYPLSSTPDEGVVSSEAGCAADRLLVWCMLKARLMPITSGRSEKLDGVTAKRVTACERYPQVAEIAVVFVGPGRSEQGAWARRSVCRQVRRQEARMSRCVRDPTQLPAQSYRSVALPSAT